MKELYRDLVAKDECRFVPVPRPSLNSQVCDHMEMVAASSKTLSWEDIGEVHTHQHFPTSDKQQETFGEVVRLKL